MIKVGTVMMMYEICDSDIVCEKHLAICIVMSAQHK